jgi:hypothetical protein
LVGAVCGGASAARAQPSAPPRDSAASQETAQDTSTRDRSDVADEANNPLPTHTRLQFKPSYTFPNGSTRYEADLLFEPILPYRAFLIPELEVPGFWSIARFQLTGESLQNSSGPASGLTDLTLTDLVARKVGMFNVAFGFVTIFPMATTTALGQGKWQLGPAVAARLEGLDWLKVAVLVQNPYSVAGSNQSPALAYATVQPFITLHLPAALFLSSDATMNFYGKGGRSTLPVNLGFGHAFGTHFVGSVRGWYTLEAEGEGDIKIELALEFQP